MNEFISLTLNYKCITRDLIDDAFSKQIVLTFDDSINFENWDFFTTKLFTPNRKNPNGCPIKGTFYVSHQFTNYQMVQKMWNDGHEIAVHSIT